MTTKQVLLEKLLRKREHKVDLIPAEGEKPAKGVKFRRPGETEMSNMLVVDKTTGKATWQVEKKHVLECVFAWYEITEADLLGAEMAPPDPVDFDPDLWAEMVGDNVEWMNKIADAILKSVVDYVIAQDAIRKN